MTDKERIISLYQDGLRISEICEELGFNRSKVAYHLKDFQTTHSAICPMCGEEYTVTGRQEKTCKDRACKYRYKKQWDKAQYEQGKSHGKIREYTQDSTMLIYEDIRRGLTIQKIAAMYDRDLDDLKQHIEKVIFKQEDKLRKRMSQYQKRSIQR